MNLSVWNFWLLLALYSIISAPFFVYTSNGWTYIFMTMGVLAVYGFLLAITFLISTILYLLGKRRVLLSRKSVFFILILQVFAGLFNTGDCGDGSGYPMPFMYRLLHLSWDCPYGDNYVLWSNASIFLSLGLMGIIILAYFWVLAKTYWSARNL